MRSVLRLYAVLKTSFAVFLLFSSSRIRTTASSCPQEQLIQPCKCSERSDEIQIWCSHGDLNSISNSLKTIGQSVNRPVDELILENNLLPSLPGQMFSSLRILRLMLRENALQRVSANWLAGTENTLQEIYIVEPELRSFPDDGVVTLPKLEALTLSAGLLTKMPAIFGLSRLRYIQIEAPAMSDIFVDNFQGLPFLEQLHITAASKIRRLDENFVHDLPKLSILNFTQCGLQYVHPRALVRLPALSELSFSGNKLNDARTIGIAIRDLPSLATVRLDRNGMTRLEEGSFVDIPSLTNLYLNDNRIVTLHRAAFHRLPHLRSLDLGHNEIRAVHPESFLPMRENLLEELLLDNNRIEHSVIVRLLLDSLPHLRLLDLSNNFLEDLSNGIIHNHMHLEMLVLENNRLQKLGREAFSGLPSLRELKLGNNSLAYHLATPYWNLPALKGLDLSRNYFEFIDRMLLAGLPSLRRFDISHNSLKNVEPATFVGSPYLEYVNVSSNDLQLLSSLTFSQLHRLFDLDISHNNLSQGISGIPRNVEYLRMADNNMMIISTATMHEFQLSALKMLDLSHNKIHSIPDTSLSALCTLRTLLLNDNSLQVISQTVFENLPQLRTLNMANNKLIMIKKDSFKKLRHLIELNLGRNRLEIFEPELLAHNPELRKLDLNGNRLTDLASNVFASNKKIEDVNLSHNALSSFPVCVAGMPTLQNLNLNHNQMTSLPNNLLPTLTSLKELHLASNKLSELSYGVFEKLPNLTMVDLENNEIQRISTRALYNLPNLVVAKMSKNKIAAVSRGAFENLPVLQSVELQENRLQDVSNDAFVSCPNLLMLNLSNNMLNEVENAGLRGLKTLEAVDLSHNRISKLTMDSVKDLNYLILLKLDNNRLCNIEGTPFEKMFRLRMLSLRDNKMTTLAENAFNKLRSSILYFDIEGNPVKCSCNMLWLQSWLQEDEQRYPGPRCSDGILLREHRIARSNCDDLLEIVPGCESVLGSASSQSATNVTGNSKMKPSGSNISPTLSTVRPVDGRLKPLPEETDYFDPKFIDYHENGTRASATHKPSTSTIPAGVLSHFVAGDTPTLYAGIKAKSNATKVPASPHSSSAFTFFGMPLPSLNLNNFWNSGKSVDGAAATAGGKSTKKHGRHETSWTPPSEADIQKNGFVPVLPGAGGFVPMNITAAAAGGQQRNGTVAVSQATRFATISKVSSPKRKEDEETVREPAAIIDQLSADGTDKTIRSNRNASASHRVGFVAKTSTEKLTDFEKTNLTSIDETVFTISDRKHDEQEQQEFIDKSATDALRLNTTSENKNDDLSPLSKFLIPGGQLASSSSTNRPAAAIVSKVQLNGGPSPHNEDAHTSHLRLAKSSLHLSSTTTATTISPATTISYKTHFVEDNAPISVKPTNDENSTNNWYFVNYNRSNIEPFVGRLPVKISSISGRDVPPLPLIFSALISIALF